MRSLPSSSSCSTSLSNRLETIFKKASELSILCEIEVCVIYYGPDGELKTWPEEKGKVRDMALRYSRLNEAMRRKKSFDLDGFLNKKKDKTNLKKRKKTSVNELKYPISDHYSPYQISQLIQSLELNVSTLQERLRFVELQKHKQHLQTQSLNPSQFSIFMYNHGDNTLSKLPLSASNFNQDVSALIQESVLKNQLMHKELCVSDQNMYMSDITNNNFQLPYVSNIENYSGVQESVNNYGLNQLMHKKLYGYDQNMCMSDVLESCISNNVSDYDFPYGNSSFS